MKIIRHISEMRKFIGSQKSRGLSIGLVPTLGALHEGHLSLIRKARKKVQTLVLSIFLNPIQFSSPSDLKSYPITFKKDLELAKAQNVDAVFCPSAKEMYRGDFSTYIVENKLSKGLCGKSRPGHFKGVTTVVAKLFNIVEPDIAFLGQKDAQQALVIQRMVRDLCWNIKIEVVPTVRDSEGLALSSRNALLSLKEREKAHSLNEALFMAKMMIASGERSSAKVVRKITKIIGSRPKNKIDYIEIVNAETLEKIKTLEGKILIALAVWFGKVRLIDNLELEV